MQRCTLAATTFWWASRHYKKKYGWAQERGRDQLFSLLKTSSLWGGSSIQAYILLTVLALYLLTPLPTYPKYHPVLPDLLANQWAPFGSISLSLDQEWREWQSVTKKDKTVKPFHICCAFSFLICQKSCHWVCPSYSMGLNGLACQGQKVPSGIGSLYPFPLSRIC